MEIELRFSNEMKVKVLGGRKCCTTRENPHGKPGDTFFLGKQRYRILQIINMYAAQVANDLYRSEGFDSPAAYIAWWTRNKGPFDPEQEVYTHFFAACLPLV